jgi:hypothetical protein
MKGRRLDGSRVSAGRKQWRGTMDLDLEHQLPAVVGNLLLGYQSLRPDPKDANDFVGVATADRLYCPHPGACTISRGVRRFREEAVRGRGRSPGPTSTRRNRYGRFSTFVISTK